MASKMTESCLKKERAINSFSSHYPKKVGWHLSPQETVISIRLPRFGSYLLKRKCIAIVQHSKEIILTELNAIRMLICLVVSRVCASEKFRSRTWDPIENVLPKGGNFLACENRRTAVFSG